MDLTQLAAEIKNDPNNLGYANNTDLQVADLLNTVGSTVIQLATLDKDSFLLNVVAPAALALSTLSDSVQAKWDRIIGVVTGATVINVSSVLVQGMLAGAVADGLLTVPQVVAATSRTGSRAEQLWGAGTFVTEKEVGQSRNGV